LLSTLTGVVLITIALRAELTPLLQNIDSTSRLEQIFFRSVTLPSGLVPVRRPPKETRAELARLLTASPNDAELTSLRALEDEQQLDFTAAEADWKHYVEIAQDKGAARVSLADYYHRRLKPQDEFNVLALAALERPPTSDPRRPYAIYERIMRLVDEQNIDAQQGAMRYESWEAQFPNDPAVYKGFFAYGIAHKLFDRAQEAINDYVKAFPQDVEFPVAARAELAASAYTPERAMAELDAAYRPLWPDSLVKQYFDVLRQNNALRIYLEKARTGAQSNPTDVQYAARLFHYWQQQNNMPAAERALIEYRQRKESRQSAWTSDELLTLARLFEASGNRDEAARNYYALYSVARSDEAVAENALGSLARLMLSAPEQPIHFGSGNLSLYRDVATMDPHPGFLNGILSLVLNETDPPNAQAIEEQRAAPYFRRAKAAELVSLFEARFPNSTQRADLRARVIETYAIYGSNEGVIRAGTKFLSDFPNATNRTEVALRVADVYARQNQTQQEFALYDTLLTELARKAGGIPLGAQAPAAATAENSDKPQTSARSPEYARVLDRYIARLATLKQVRQGLVVYRQELDRNPNDPGLFDSMAAFLEQNSLTAETEQVYQRAIAQFQDHSWQHKLARWYLRQRRTTELTNLTRQVIGIFSGSELESYFEDAVVDGVVLGPNLTAQLNLAAHQRFPHNMSFVRRLLNLYSTAPTVNDSAYETLLRQNWYQDPDLRLRFFERLSSRGRLDAELNIARTSNPSANSAQWQTAVDQSPATVRLLAEGESWRCHFEAAAPMFQALETSYPAEPNIGIRAASVYRSLGTIDPKLTDTALTVETNLSTADPRDHGALTRRGEMEAEREQFAKARVVWDKIPEVEPSKSDGYLETATLYWDYYQYGDAIRWIEEARRRLKDPNLYAYEAGAIHENQRDNTRALAEYARGAIYQPGSNAQRRLILLARRPALRQQADTLTDNLVSARNPSAPILHLRIAVLKDQNRRDDLERLLQLVASRSDSNDVLADVGNEARISGFPKIEQTALEHRVALTTDPVDKMSLRLALAHFLEGQGQAAQGAQVMDAVYRENPAILGVVRGAVDFHWRNHNQKRAVDVLEEAANRAEPGFRTSFTLEAAHKSTESGDYARARGFAEKLLAAQPFNSEYIATMAAIYSRQGDDAGLRALYTAKIQDLQKADMSPAERAERIAQMRRTLIPVLIRAKDYQGAVDQYIEVLNRYPEDMELAREAATFAQTNGVGPRLHDYYAKAANDSPKDFRWPMVLARIETTMEDYPAAIGSYTKAVTVRPDRTDLLAARLNLEERLLRFDEAASTAQRLYDLSYRDAHWLEELAQIRARQGRNADALAALTGALILPHPNAANGYFEAANRLESWGMFAEARPIVEKAFTLSGNKDGEPDAGIRTYARLMARLRNHDVFLARMIPWGPNSSARAATELGQAVAQFYSPDDQVKFAASIERQGRRIQMAQAAGMVDLEVKYRVAAMMGAPASENSAGHLQRVIELQHQRLRLDELGQQLEAYDRVVPLKNRGAYPLTAAVEAYRASGNTGAELRVLGALHSRQFLRGPELDRYAKLLAIQPQRFTIAISQEKNDEAANQLVGYAIAHGSAALAQQAVAARGMSQGDLWKKAYTALTGLYFASNTPAVKTAFTDILGNMTIGSRLMNPTDRDDQLAGEPWFYYGGRYGEYLAATKQTGADDYLPSMVEASPASSNAYFQLAEYYFDAGNPTAATSDYRYALELKPSRVDVHDRLALIAARAGRTAEATAEWKLALQSLTNVMNGSGVSQAFWVDLNQVIRHIGEAKLLPALRPDLDPLLKLYVRRNGTYQIDSIEASVMAASIGLNTGDTNSGIAWLLDLSRFAADPIMFLQPMLDQNWLPRNQRDLIYARIVEAAQANVAQKFGDEQYAARVALWNWQASWVDYLLDERQNERARDLLAQIPEEARRPYGEHLVLLEIRVANRFNVIAQQLAKYQEPLPLDSLKLAAGALVSDSAPVAALQVLTFVYQHQLAAGSLDMATFLGLADVKLADNDVPGALQLLRRMTLVSGANFEGYEPAADLLERTGHTKEAQEFLAAWAKSSPWSPEARLRLAAATGTVSDVAVLAQSKDIAYSVRLDAASAINRLKGDPLTATEPELIALSAQQLPADVSTMSPYAIHIRYEVANAQQNATNQERILLAVVAVAPQTPKLTLFRAALNQRHDALADAIGRQFISGAPNEARERVTEIAPNERVIVGRGMGDVNVRLGEPQRALYYYGVAENIQPADNIRRTMETLRAQLDLEAQNAERRPLIKNEVEQDRLVRPRETR
jgi:Tfp pilus assembly protein PilF